MLVLEGRPGLGIWLEGTTVGADGNEVLELKGDADALDVETVPEVNGSEPELEGGGWTLDSTVEPGSRLIVMSKPAEREPAELGARLNV